MVCGACVEVFVALDGVVLSAEPTVEALLAAVAFPHGEESGEFFEGGDATYDVEDFVVGLS